MYRCHRLNPCREPRIAGNARTKIVPERSYVGLGRPRGQAQVVDAQPHARHGRSPRSSVSVMMRPDLAYSVRAAEAT
jgi:hypothetical protein